MEILSKLLLLNQAEKRFYYVMQILLLTTNQRLRIGFGTVDFIWKQKKQKQQKLQFKREELGDS